MAEAFDRFTRQAALAPRDRLESLDVTVVGVGAIGRQLALQLASLGVRRLRLVDFDMVESTNVTTQGYRHEDVGIAKVVATAGEVRRIDPTIELEVVEDRFRGRTAMGDVLFCCVDSIAARSAIWQHAGNRCQFWGDGRMRGEVMRILAVTDEAGRRHYRGTLFNPNEVQSGGCTARGVIYTAAIAAGLLCHQFTRWLRGLPADQDVSLNLLASELAPISDSLRS